MKPVHYLNGSLAIGDVALADIAHKAGTPCYVYSADRILENYFAYENAFGSIPHTVCYAVKANGNLSILRMLASQGAGFDIVSGGELYRVLQAGGDPSKVVFSGVGKTADEINAALDAGIFAFNAESEPELALIDALAHRRGIQARVSLRVNPGVDADTHAHLATGAKKEKFGVDIDEAEGVFERARQFSNLLLEGVSCHIGSLLANFIPATLETAGLLIALIDRLRAKGFPIHHADLGGGLPVAYRPGEVMPTAQEFLSAIVPKFAGRDLRLMIEPGRSIVADAGVLLTRVLYRKRTGTKEFVIVDAAMTELIRPSLYDAYHEILPARQSNRPPLHADIVGPVCETGDFLAKDRDMPESLPGDLLAVCTAGAYGFAQASNYNARARPAEVLVEGSSWRIIRQRETLADLVRGESGE